MQHLQNEYIENYKTYLMQLGYSKSSVNMLPTCVKDFLETVDKNIKNIEKPDIIKHYEHLQTRPNKRKSSALSESYISHNIYALKLFFNWLEQTDQIKHNPISTLKFKRPKSNTRQPLSKEEITQLFENCASSKEIAILHLFYSCGLRRTEAENLNTGDIHFAQNIVYVRAGKGTKRRAIPVTEKVKKELESYFVNDRKKQIAKDEEAVFLNANRTRMKGDQYNKILKTIVARSKISTANTSFGGLGEVTTLHHLRHSIATHLLENGLSTEFVRDFLGHSSLEATQIYTKVKAHQLKKL